MKRDIVAFVFLFLIAFFTYGSALGNFFAQDDFIFIEHFSQKDLLSNIKNVFGPPVVTHWRPMHNSYFLILGNLFDKNYFYYHLLTLFLHVGTGFFIYKTTRYLLNDSFNSFLASLFYIANPSHFISLNWISGGSTTIGFFFLLASIHSFFVGKTGRMFIFFILAVLASEAMLVGVVIFYALNVFRRKRLIFLDKELILLGVTSIIFFTVRFFSLTPKGTFEVYTLEITNKIFDSTKYYLSRTVGFAEVSGDYLTSIVLIVFLSIIGIILFRLLSKKRERQLLFVLIIIIGIGLFPFILIPNHLSPHYMNVSIWGFSMFLALILKNLKPLIAIILIIVYVSIANINIGLIKKDNWVINRSNLARDYIKMIEYEKPRNGTKLVFADNVLSSSKEAYIVLGQGKAINFWFPDKNYGTCFSAFENCEPLP